MKEFTPKELTKANPELSKEIERAVTLAAPHIHDHVVMTLMNQPAGSVALHATFMRLVDEDENTIFVEVEMQCWLELRCLVVNAKKIVFHDSLEAYEEHRIKVMEESEKQWGGSMPAVSQYGGIKINLN